VAKRKGDCDDSYARSRSSSRLVGALLLAAIVALVGWSFKTTLDHDKEIPVIKQRLYTNESEIRILRNEHLRHKDERSKHHAHRN